MKIYKTKEHIIIEEQGSCYLLTDTWDELMVQQQLWQYLQDKIAQSAPVGDAQWLAMQQLAVPIGTQEVWAAGVTYLRSKNARMEESKDSGGATFYDKVYDAERPEIFFKSTAQRVIPCNGFVRIRKDSTWNVPEPELTLVINPAGTVIGYTIGNDMSSRSIEGENPLYLPQAKMYDGSAAIGPCVLITHQLISPATVISMRILRNAIVVFEGRVTISQMKRTHDELVEFLFREYSYPVGAYLMTGTCVVPENDFTLASGDIIEIAIGGIGVLINTVE